MKFSVIIPAYNASETVLRAIQSVLAQSYNDFELIVIDDASSDDTWNVVREAALQDSRVRCFRNENNLDVGATRNLAIDLSNGDWILPLDADDSFNPERLAVFAEYLAKHDSEMVADNQILIKDNKTIIGKMYKDCDFIFQDIVSPSQFVYRNIVNETQWPLGYMKPCIKRSFLVSKGLKYRPEISVTEDFIFYLDCLLEGAKLRFMSYAGYNYSVCCPGSKTCKGLSKEILEKRVAINNLMSARESVKLHPGLEEALMTLNKKWLTMLNVHILKAHIKGGRVLQALNVLRCNPYLLPVVAKRFLQKVILNRSAA